jgi:hypothetical protein
VKNWFQTFAFKSNSYRYTWAAKKVGEARNKVVAAQRTLDAKEAEAKKVAAVAKVGGFAR